MAPPPLPPPPPLEPPPSSPSRLARALSSSVAASRRLSVSQRLLSIRGLTNSAVWIEDEAEVWSRATVESQVNTMLTCRRARDGQLVTVDLGFTGTSAADASYGHSDLTSLQHIHEAALLENLHVRAGAKQPYTYMGSVLVAVNPLQPLPQPDVQDFTGRGWDSDRPHPYGLAEQLYQQLHLRDPAAAGGRNNQSLIISGESGAGKSETCKMVLQFLVQRASPGAAGSGLDERFVQSSPILEAFGNAQTVRNRDSSRFGKFLLTSYSGSASQGTETAMVLKGGQIETYLLEKSRVVRLGEGERNFHVFYQLLAGLSEAEKGPLGLAGKRPEDFLYLRNDRHNASASAHMASTSEPHAHSSSSKARGAEDDDERDSHNRFTRLRGALQAFGVDLEAGQPGLWRALAAILHLGNVRVTAKEAASGTVAVLEPAALEQVAALLGVPADRLAELLSKRKVTTRGETIMVPLSPQDASYALDAAAKDMYARLFNWAVRRVNYGLRIFSTTPQPPPPPDAVSGIIGLLDMFGFESFERNSLEQLLINQANEAMQQLFNMHLFKAELDLYRAEGITINLASRPDNTECLALLLSKPLGVLPLLDATSLGLEPSDDKYLASLHKHHARHPYFPKTHPRDKPHAFFIKHYAGEVKYAVGGDWVAKNNDAVPEGLAELLASADAHPLLKEAFAPMPQASNKTGATSSAASKKETVTSRFLLSMERLSDALAATRCNFVRCIKPNAAMTPGVFDRRYVVGQLRCLGLVQSCEVLKVGLPTRLRYADIKAQLQGLPPSVTDLFKDDSSEEAFVSCVLWAFGVPEEAYRLGRTRVFFRAGQSKHVQAILQVDMAAKGEWVAGRLKEAVESRKAAARLLEQAEALAAELTDSEVRAKELYLQVTDADAALTAAIRAHDQRLTAGLAQLQECEATVEAAQSLLSNALPAPQDSLEARALLEVARSRLRSVQKRQDTAREGVVRAKNKLAEFKTGSWTQGAIVAWEKLRAVEGLSTEMDKALDSARVAADRCDRASVEAAISLGQQLVKTRAPALLQAMQAQLPPLTRALEQDLPALEAAATQQAQDCEAAAQEIGSSLVKIQGEVATAQEKEAASRREKAAEAERRRKEQEAEAQAEAARAAERAQQAQAEAEQARLAELERERVRKQKEVEEAEQARLRREQEAAEQAALAAKELKVKTESMMERLQQSPRHQAAVSSSKPSSPFVGSPGGARSPAIGSPSSSSRPVSASYMILRSPGVALPGMARVSSPSGVLLVRSPPPSHGAPSVSSPFKARSPIVRSPVMAQHHAEDARAEQAERTEEEQEAEAGGVSSDEEEDEDLGRGSIVSVRSVHLSRADLDALLQLQAAAVASPTSPSRSLTTPGSVSSSKPAVAASPSDQPQAAGAAAVFLSPPTLKTPPFSPPQLHLPDDDDDDNDDSPRQEQDDANPMSPTRAAALLVMLPPGWIETVSETYGVPYYTNKFTNESRWDRPTEPARSRSGRLYPSGDDDHVTARMDEERKVPLPEGYYDGQDDDDDEEEDLSPLPEGWREYRSEAHGGLPYYFNLLTKETVWERPGEAAMWPQDDQDEDHGPVSPDTLEEETKAPPHHSPAPSTGSAAPSPPAGPARRSAPPLPPRPSSVLTLTTPPPASSGSPSILTQDSLRSAAAGPPAERKEGYVLKKSTKFFGPRWKKRYLVLEPGGRLRLFRDKADASVAATDANKTLELDAESVVAFSSMDKGLAVRSGERSWLLALQTDRDVEAWHAAITAHIFEIRREVMKLQQDLMSEAKGLNSVRLLYMMDTDPSLPPIGIRMAPEIDAPKRDSRVILPGDVIEVESIVADPNVGVLFLGLPNGKGWVLDRHPASKRVLMHKVPGRFELPEGSTGLQPFFLRAVKDLDQPLPILRTPLCDVEKATPNDRLIWSGEAVRVRERFVPDGKPAWLKVEDSSGYVGWVPSVHPASGKTLFVPESS